MKFFTSTVMKFPRQIIGVIFLITLFMLWGTTKLKVRNNQESELPADDPIVQTMNHIKETFDDKSIVIVGIETRNIYNTETLKKIDQITRDLKKVEGVIPDEVISLSTVNNIKSHDGILDTGPFMQELPKNQAEVDQLKQDVQSNENIYGQLVSKDGTFTMIRANVKDGYSQGTVHKQVYEIVHRYTGPEKIYASGEPIWLEDIESGINADSQMLTPVALLVMLGFFYLCFQTWRGVFLPITITILSIIWTMGMMGHLGLPITVVSNALPALMVATASSYGIHVVHRYYEEIIDKKREAAVKEMLTRLTMPVIMTGLTSAIGAGSLGMFKVTSIREFGLIGAMGTIATLILTITLIPSMLLLLKRDIGKPGHLEFINTQLARLSGFVMRNKMAVLAGYAVLMVISIIGIKKIIVGADFVQSFPKDHRGRISVDAFNDKLGGARFFNIMVEGKTEDDLKDPKFLSEILKFEEYMKKQPGVGSTFSFADIIKRMHQVMNKDSVGISALPDSKELIAQYLLLYSMSGSPGDFSDMVDHDYQRAKIQVILKTSEPQDHKKLYQLANDYFAVHMPEAKASFGGDIMLWLAQIDHIVTGKIWNTITSILTILGFCMVVYRSITGGIFSIVPLCVSITTIFGLMGFIGIRLDIGTAIMTAIIAGIGIDYALHYLNRFKEEVIKTDNVEDACVEVARTCGKAISYDVMSNVFSFSVLLFSGFMPVKFFGGLMALCNFIVGLNTLILFPVLMAMFMPMSFRRKMGTAKLEKKSILVMEEPQLIPAIK